MNDVLEPISARYGTTLIIGTGELSATHCNLAIDRAEEDEDGRPVRILYISDFDPAGLSMPVAAARKIEFFARKRNPDLDIQLIPIALTHEQCVQYRLPRTPLKATEQRREKFEERFGAGATELDALEALHPGVLAEIVERAILRFHDGTLNSRTRAAARPVEEKLEQVTQAAHRRHRRKIADLRREYAEITAARASWQKRAMPIWRAIASEIRAEIEPIIDAIEWPEPREAHEYEGPLYDSTRGYTEQVEHYKTFQGKATEGDPDE
jgi:hypothetical protein